MSTFEKVQLVIKEVISMVINKEEKKKLSIGKKNCFSEMLKKKKKKIQAIERFKRDHEA